MGPGAPDSGLLRDHVLIILGCVYLGPFVSAKATVCIRRGRRYVNSSSIVGACGETEPFFFKSQPVAVKGPQHVVDNRLSYIV